MMEILEIEQPLYTIKRYTEDTYSVCKFKRSRNVIVHREEAKEYDEKLDNSFSRARSAVKQYGLCNPWQYFVTLTLDKTKYNRNDLGKFKSDLSQFVRDMRKKYKQEGSERLSYLFVPENHKDGAWHMHGLIYGLPAAATSPFIRGKHPKKLIDGGYLNWTDYEKKFGFVSLGVIRDQTATVLYATKYINKSIEALSELKGEHLYMVSRPLKKAEKIADVFLHCDELDKVASEEYKFCRVGMAYNKDWTWPFQFDEAGCYDLHEYLHPASVKPIKEPSPVPYRFNPIDIDPTYQESLF